MKDKRKKGKSAKPGPVLTQGPATNRRKGNRQVSPAKGGRRFVQRSAVNDPGPEDVSGFDA